MNDWVGAFSTALTVLIPTWLALMVHRLLAEDE